MPNDVFEKDPFPNSRKNNNHLTVCKTAILGWKYTRKVYDHREFEHTSLFSLNEHFSSPFLPPPLPMIDRTGIHLLPNINCHTWIPNKQIRTPNIPRKGCWLLHPHRVHEKAARVVGRE
ncbi:hypothetical protein CDAR_60451 [Caerostris darwini]|uniref:Ycf15 n=1 Tax=Caerostris darwini TaxID=1538125 RepID=A0AAV4QLS0_9ARAC|nr:hypothetical protein CDAR_60451 [Caerostris darwini]